MFNDHHLGLGFITADVVTLDLPMRWAPKTLRSPEGHRALLTGCASALRSDHDSELSMSFS